MKKMEHNMFEIKDDQNGHLLFLGHKQDTDKMNWIEGRKKWGTINCPEGITVVCSRELTVEGHLKECYCFKNNSEFPVFFQKVDLGIYTTFNDDYESAEICMTQKCHTHIFCNGEASYIKAVKMGGQSTGLGMMLIEGSLSGYSVERRTEIADKEEVVSNDRGDFILHPDIHELLPGESADISWELFWFDTQAEFERKLVKSGKQIYIKARQCTYFKGEEIVFDVLFGENIKQTEIQILCNQKEKKFSCQWDEEMLQVCCRFDADETGEYQIEVQIGTRKAKALFFVSPDLRTLAGSRCKFIAEKQQYDKAGTALEGAYLIYDKEENKMYYNHILHDHNGGRERLGMGALMALYLQKEDDKELRRSLEQYVQFVYRELYDKETGTVFNDICHNQEWHRLYNYPWMAILQLEMYRLTKEKSYLADSYRTMRQYYLSGGDSFYAIGIPVQELTEELEALQMEEEAEELKKLFFKQVEYIVKNSIFYPPSEVNYEQSIVAPAVSCLLQGTRLSGNEQYMEEAERQLAILRQFNGRQPDFHQFENAIRHWDGYWFGKYRMLGDTYPHYWSVLTGVAYMQYAETTGSEAYKELAKASFRGCLNLFSENGEASCAMVFPETVNGKKAHFYDPWANDQDWALYYALKYEAVVTKL